MLLAAVRAAVRRRRGASVRKPRRAEAEHRGSVRSPQHERHIPRHLLPDTHSQIENWSTFNYKYRPSQCSPLFTLLTIQIIPRMGRSRLPRGVLSHVCFTGAKTVGLPARYGRRRRCSRAARRCAQAPPMRQHRRCWRVPQPRRACTSAQQMTCVPWKYISNEHWGSSKEERQTHQGQPLSKALLRTGPQAF